MDQSIRIHRSNFPRGLSQLTEGYRFSIDSLLLAAFARLRRDDRRGLDLGTGCGVVALGLLLRFAGRDLRLTGLEQDPESAGLARENAERLGFSQQFDVRIADVSSYDFSAEAHYDFVSCNPPFREPGRGKANPAPEKARARFETGSGLAGFLAAAARALKTRGRLFLVHLPERLPALCEGLLRNGLEPKRLRLVHGRVEEPPRILLLEAVRAARPGLAVEPPLVLYSGPGAGQALSPAALAFCPFLQCNPGTSEPGIAAPGRPGPQPSEENA